LDITEVADGWVSGAGTSDIVVFSDEAVGYPNLRTASDTITLTDAGTYVFIPITDLPTPMVLDPAVATQTLESARTTLTLDPGIGTLAIRDEPTGIRIDGP
jgi:hypothetical protein